MGPHTETGTLVDRFLTGANVPSRTGVSLFAFNNSLAVKTEAGAVQGDPALQLVLGEFRGKFGGRSGVPEGDGISAGSGLWLFMAADDELTSVLDRE